LRGTARTDRAESFDKEDGMSEDESRRVAAQDEAGDEADTEAHARRVAANEEAADEAEGDDVEAHSRRSA
jgi:hypothetical protein